MKCIVDWLLRIVYEESLVSDIGRACLMEVGYNLDGGQDEIMLTFAILYLNC